MSAFLHKLVDLYQLAMHNALRHAPIEVASALGSLLVRTNVKLNRPDIIAGARRNLMRHRPDASPQEVNAMIWRFLDNVGRHMGECSVLEKIVEPERLEVLGLAACRGLLGKVPVLSIHLHTGNWEVFGPALALNGVQAATFYEPPTSAVQRRIVEKARLQAGFELLTPDKRGLRGAIVRLRNNGVVSIACDEARAGRLMAPLFGRPPHAKGNLAVAAKLARHANAHIVISHCERLPNCRFRLHISTPFTLPEAESGLLEDVRFLNDRLEPVILAHLDQWYYLDDSIEVVA